MKGMSNKLEALAAMPPEQLHREWEALSGESFPSASASLLRHMIAYRLQQKRFGKLPVQIERQLDRIANGGTNGRLEPDLEHRPKTRSAIPIGTRFVREWNGKTIIVTAVEAGFEWDGKAHRSLSEIARKVTGAHWSGPRFFGLNQARN